MRKIAERCQSPTGVGNELRVTGPMQKNLGPPNAKRTAPVRCTGWLGVSKGLIVVNILPQPVLMEPNRVDIPSDELIDIHAVYLLRPPNPLLLSVDENHHELFSSLLACPLLGSSQFSLTLSHGSSVKTP